LPCANRMPAAAPRGVLLRRREDDPDSDDREPTWPVDGDWWRWIGAGRWPGGRSPGARRRWTAPTTAPAKTGTPGGAGRARTSGSRRTWAATAEAGASCPLRPRRRERPSRAPASTAPLPTGGTAPPPWSARAARRAAARAAPSTARTPPARWSRGTAARGAPCGPPWDVGTCVPSSRRCEPRRTEGRSRCKSVAGPAQPTTCTISPEPRAHQSAQADFVCLLRRIHSLCRRAARAPISTAPPHPAHHPLTRSTSCSCTGRRPPARPASGSGASASCRLAWRG
jgi:hypothetical protein